LLGGGRSIGGGRTPSREELDLRDCRSICFSGAQEHICARDSSSKQPGSRAHHQDKPVYKPRQGPKRGTQPPESGSGQKKDRSKVRCFACGEMGHYVGQCLKRKKKKQCDGTTTTTEEREFITQFESECAFVSYLSVDTPSNVRWGDKVEEDLLTHSVDSEGA
jgi:hypothetical protein